MDEPKTTIHTAGPVENGNFQCCVNCQAPLIDYRNTDVVSLVLREVATDRLLERENTTRQARPFAPLFWQEGAEIGRRGSTSFVLQDRGLCADEKLCGVRGTKVPSVNWMPLL